MKEEANRPQTSRLEFIIISIPDYHRKPPLSSSCDISRTLGLVVTLKRVN